MQDNFLIEASCKGNLDYVKKALQNGANLNAFDETEFVSVNHSVFHLLYGVSNFDNFNFNFYIQGRKTCLWYASENGHNNVVYFLLHHGADPNFRCEVNTLYQYMSICGTII